VKSDPQASPNGKFIVYGAQESLGENRLSPLSVMILDLSGKEIRGFREVPMKKLGDICRQGSVGWVDDDRVGVECEYNPSGEDYVVLDAVSGKTESEFTGLYFSWSPDRRTLAHIGWIMHFATPANQNYCILFNDTPVYTPGCSNEVSATPKKASASRAGSNHYQNIHEISYPLVWSPDGRKLAFVEAIYDFDWGTDEKGEETRQTGNYRFFLAIVSAGHAAVGYQMSEPVGEPQLEWLNDSRVRVRSGANAFERTFDLVANPPKRIP
jgi:hypothetical protein